MVLIQNSLVNYGSKTMTHIPIPERSDNQKLKGGFYALQREELIALKQTKLINNAAYVHFALRIENPFCDRPMEIVAKDFAQRWKIPEVSFYKAIAKLKEADTINIKSGTVVIEWVSEAQTETSESDESDQNLSNPENTIESDSKLSNPENTIESDNDLSNPIMDYQNGKQIIKFDNELSNPIMDYQNGKNEPPKPLPEKDFEVSQTKKTYKNFKDSLSEEQRERFFNFVKRDIVGFRRPIIDLEAWLASETKAGEKRWEFYYKKFEQREKTPKRPSLSQEIEERRQRLLAEERDELKAKGQNTPLKRTQKHPC